VLLKLSSLTIPALWVAHIAAAQTAPAAYTLIQTNSMGGAASTVTLYRDGNLVVSDTQQDTTRTRTLSNLSTHTSTSWDVANPSNGCSSGTFSDVNNIFGSGSFSGAGTYTLASGATFQFNSPLTSTISGTLNGAGTVLFSTGTVL